ncbi:head maturation protease, ClpP-related [Selenomonas sp. F0473]|uniref:head maturation protease, ClpP-related n=1 Tax=Selenomonas sp. F0473 TaxID=999423 RepID=UPI0025FB336E|nr:head maturation protease, ClpP-related [Selenomonas sp. F0473]
MKKFWEFKNTAGGNAELLLYGEISETSWYGDEITPKAFAEDLRTIGGRPLTVRVNSPGGDVFAAHSIYNQLKAYPGHVTIHIDGLAASAATIVTCAGDSVIMAHNALFMIHNPSTLAMGDAADMRRAAELLDTVRRTIISVYQKRTGDRLSEEELIDMMESETWMEAEDARAHGFVDRVSDDTAVKNRIVDGVLFAGGVSCRMDQFKHADRIVALLCKKENEVKAMDQHEVVEKIKNLLGMGESKETVAAQAAESSEQAERLRMLALDELDDRKSAAVTKMIAIAKENGSTADQIRPYIDAVREETPDMKVIDAIKALIRDNLESGAEGITASTPPQDEAEKKRAAIDEVAAIANKKRG